MQLAGEYAVVSYCGDLTSPAAKSVPVAVLLIAREGKEACIAASAAIDQLDELDPVGQGFLSKITHILKDHVNQAVKRYPQATPREILYELHNSLRNSLHVTSIKEADEVVLPERVNHEAAMTRIYETITRLLLKERADAGVDQPAAAPSDAPKKSKKKTRKVTLFPSTQVWPLHEAWA